MLAGTSASTQTTGTPESIGSPDQETHLHWELPLGDSYLGEGLPPEDVRAIYEGLFEPVPVRFVGLTALSALTTRRPRHDASHATW